VTQQLDSARAVVLRWCLLLIALVGSAPLASSISWASQAVAFGNFGSVACYALWRDSHTANLSNRPRISSQVSGDDNQPACVPLVLLSTPDEFSGRPIGPAAVVNIVETSRFFDARGPPSAIIRSGLPI